RRPSQSNWTTRRDLAMIRNSHSPPWCRQPRCALQPLRAACRFPMAFFSCERLAPPAATWWWRPRLIFKPGRLFKPMPCRPVFWTCPCRWARTNPSSSARAWCRNEPPACVYQFEHGLPARIDGRSNFKSGLLKIAENMNKTRALIASVTLATTSSVWSQGTVYLNNYDSGFGIFEPDGKTAAFAGTYFEVLGGLDGNPLPPIASSQPGSRTIFQIQEG